MFFRASMDSIHGTSSVKPEDWPPSDCQLQNSLQLASPSSAAAVVQPPAPLSVARVIPTYDTKFDAFVLRPDNKILVEDGSSRDASSTMLKVGGGVAPSLLLKA